MVRDVEATRRRVREAALAEFADHGLHGTTMERIARRAGVNKERVYSHFGDKRALFDIIIRGELEQIAAAVPVTITQLPDVGRFAGETFDYLQAHPDLGRLLLWEGLADDPPVPEDSPRGALYAGKVAAMADAQRRGIVDDTIAADHLLFLLFGLAGWWAASPQIARLLTRAEATDPAETARRRASVIEAALRIADPA